MTLNSNALQMINGLGPYAKDSLIINFVAADLFGILTRGLNEKTNFTV